MMLSPSLSPFVCSLVCLSVTCEFCEFTHYVAAPGNEWRLIVSTVIQLFS